MCNNYPNKYDKIKKWPLVSKMRLCAIPFLSFLLICSSCKKFVEVDPPSTSLTGAVVYQDDVTAIAVLNGLYSQMMFNSTLSGISGISVKTGLSADELAIWPSSTNASLQSFYSNSLSAQQSTGIWEGLYNYIFTVNSVLEALKNSSNLSQSVKVQLEGEAKFLRAFCYFYLANLYGSVPLQTKTDWRINSIISRSSVADIYQQIIVDLKESQSLLNEKYLNGSLQLYTSSIERVRPTKWAATALLSRVYLFKGEWSNADIEATKLITRTTDFDTVALNNVFVKNSKETIWQLQPVINNQNTQDGSIFILPSGGPSNSFPVYLNNILVNEFEPNDLRKINWTNNVTVGSVKYFYPFKYKLGGGTTPGSEYLMIFRLGEQYLIRAEARAQQNQVLQSQQDLNIIRKRAGLSNTSANDKTTLLSAIEHERQIELFTELGHRWLDIKRTNRVDQIMAIAAPLKGGTWNSSFQLYPLRSEDIRLNPNLTQNSGY